MYLEQNPRRRSTSSSRPSMKPSRRVSYREELEDNIDYDDNVSIDYGTYDEDGEEFTSIKKKAPKLSTVEEINNRLERIEKHLAKLEGMLSRCTASASAGMSTLPSSSMQEQFKPRAGSMLAEVQAAVAQTDFFSNPAEPGLTSTSNPLNNDVTSVGSLPASSYDDDIPNIIGLD